MGIKHIGKVSTPLIIGKYYKVPCAVINFDSEDFNIGEVVPIIGDLHQDLEFEVEAYHYHLDRRFTDRQLSPLILIAGLNFATGEFIYPTEIVSRRLKCLTNQVDILPAEVGRMLEPKYENCSLENGFCPHRNIDLRTYQPDESGNVICPAHALKWNIESGRMIPRWSASYKPEFSIEVH